MRKWCWCNRVVLEPPPPPTLFWMERPEMLTVPFQPRHFPRYYFVVEEDNTPLSVTVTPCDAPLEWKLTLQELPEEASGEASGTGTRGVNDAVMVGSVPRRGLIKSQSWCLV